MRSLVKERGAPDWLTAVLFIAVSVVHQSYVRLLSDRPLYATCVLIDSRYIRCKSWIQTLARADYILLRFVEFSGLAYSFMRLSTVAASWTINGNCWVNNLLYKWCFSAQKFVSYVQTIHLCFMLGHRLILENALCVRICEAWCSDTDCWTRFHYFQESEYATGV
jgi:hypothetical protein